MARAEYFTSWSFSRWVDYTLCPLKAYLAHIKKIREPKNDAMQRGADIHDMASGYIKGKIKKLPAELKLFKLEFDKLKKQYKKSISGMVVEDDWAFTQGWDQTRWDDWIGCWVRIKLDCAHHEDEDTLIVTDWKTGKFREEDNALYLAQLELYALAALILQTHLEAVKPRLVYLDLGIVYPPEAKPLTYKRADIKKLKQVWEKRVKPMMADRKFAPRPNDKCRWCFFGQSGKIKGGPGLCKF